MNISISAKQFAATIKNKKGEVVTAIQYDNYEAEVDLLGLIDAAGSVGEALRALQERALNPSAE